MIPLEHGRRAQVQVATTSAGKRGLRGLIEKLSVPPVARCIYRDELRRPAEYAHTGEAGTAHTAG
jgi:hypothetical protein